LAIDFATWKDKCHLNGAGLESPSEAQTAAKGIAGLPGRADVAAPRDECGNVAE
jgi:hypothetical protein